MGQTVERLPFQMTNLGVTVDSFHPGAPNMPQGARLCTFVADFSTEVIRQETDMP